MSALRLVEPGDVEQEFVHAATRNVKLFAYFAPKITDFENPEYCDLIVKPRRLQTVAEVMADALGCKNGPEAAELMQLMADAARGEDIRPQALNLVKRMASTWTAMNPGALS